MPPSETNGNSKQTKGKNATAETAIREKKRIIIYQILSVCLTKEIKGSQ
jgi:hypothetical protein